MDTESLAAAHPHGAALASPQMLARLRPPHLSTAVEFDVLTNAELQTASPGGSSHPHRDELFTPTQLAIRHEDMFGAIDTMATRHPARATHDKHIGVSPGAGLAGSPQLQRVSPLARALKERRVAAAAAVAELEVQRARFARATEALNTALADAGSGMLDEASWRLIGVSNDHAFSRGTADSGTFTAETARVSLGNIATHGAVAEDELAGVADARRLATRIAAAAKTYATEATGLMRCRCRVRDAEHDLSNASVAAAHETFAIEAAATDARRIAALEAAHAQLLQLIVRMASAEAAAVAAAQRAESVTARAACEVEAAVASCRHKVEGELEAAKASAAKALADTARASETAILRMREELDSATVARDAAMAAHAQLLKERTAAQAVQAELEMERDSLIAAQVELQKKCDAAQDAQAQLQEERGSAQAVQAELRSAYDAALASQAQLRSEHGIVLATKAELRSELDTALSGLSQLRITCDSLLAAQADLRSERDSLLATVSQLCNERDTVLVSQSELRSTCDSLLAVQTDLRSERDAALAERAQLQAQIDVARSDAAAAVETITRERDEALASAAAAQTSVSTWQAAARDAGERADAAVAAVARAESAAAAVAESRDSASSAVASLQRTVAGLSGLNGELQKQATELLAAAQSAARERDDALDAVDAANRDLTAARETVAAANVAMADARSKISAAEAVAHSVSLEATTLAQQHRVRIAELEADIAEAVAARDSACAELAALRNEISAVRSELSLRTADSSAELSVARAELVAQTAATTAMREQHAADVAIATARHDAIIADLVRRSETFRSRLGDTGRSLLQGVSNLKADIAEARRESAILASELTSVHLAVAATAICTAVADAQRSSGSSSAALHEAAAQRLIAIESERDAAIAEASELSARIRACEATARESESALRGRVVDAERAAEELRAAFDAQRAEGASVAAKLHQLRDENDAQEATIAALRSAVARAGLESAAAASDAAAARAAATDASAAREAASARESKRLVDLVALRDAELAEARSSTASLESQLLRVARAHAAELQEAVSKESARITEVEARVSAELAAVKRRAADVEAQLRAEVEAERSRVADAEARLITDRAAADRRLADAQAQFRAEQAAADSRVADAEARLSADLAAANGRVAHTEARMSAEITAANSRVAAAEARLSAETAAARAQAHADVEVARSTAQGEYAAQLSAAASRLAAVSAECEQLREAHALAVAATAARESEAQALSQSLHAALAHVRETCASEVAARTAAEAARDAAAHEVTDHDVLHRQAMMESAKALASARLERDSALTAAAAAAREAATARSVLDAAVAAARAEERELSERRARESAEAAAAELALHRSAQDALAAELVASRDTCQRLHERCAEAVSAETASRTAAACAAHSVAALLAERAALHARISEMDELLAVAQEEAVGAGHGLRERAVSLGRGSAPSRAASDAVMTVRRSSDGVVEAMPQLTTASTVPPAASTASLSAVRNPLVNDAALRATFVDSQTRGPLEGGPPTARHAADSAFLVPPSALRPPPLRPARIRVHSDASGDFADEVGPRMLERALPWQDDAAHAPPRPPPPQPLRTLPRVTPVHAPVVDVGGGGSVSPLQLGLAPIGSPAEEGLLYVRGRDVEVARGISGTDSPAAPVNHLSSLPGIIESEGFATDAARPEAVGFAEGEAAGVVLPAASPASNSIEDGAEQVIARPSLLHTLVRWVGFGGGTAGASAGAGAAGQPTSVLGLPHVRSTELTDSAAQPVAKSPAVELTSDALVQPL